MRTPKKNNPGKRENQATGNNSIGQYEISFNGDQLISVDDAVCRYIGYSREELLSMNPLRLLDDRSIDAFARTLLRKVVDDKEDKRVEFRVKTKDGQPKAFIAELVEFRYRDGSPVSVVVSASDITDSRTSS